MAEKSLVNDETDNDAAFPPALVVVLPLEDLLDDEPHAATRAVVVTRATDQTQARLNETFMIPSRWDTSELPVDAAT
jgi:hypothetical protein